jgi:hypothetical protein
MMGIVHGALMRDLARCADVLTAAAPPVGDQRVAVGRHVEWMMDFLHAHHTSEDLGLWPLLVSRNPGAATLVASLEEDHARIAPAADRLAGAGRAYAAATDDPSRTSLVDALDSLVGVLAPHLEREVAEAMPVVERSITQVEWTDVERRFNLAPKSTRQLAFEGHWLLDGLDRGGREVVVSVVPPVQRFVLLHGFARMYRRHSAACWSPVVPARQAPVR